MDQQTAQELAKHIQQNHVMSGWLITVIVGAAVAIATFLLKWMFNRAATRVDNLYEWKEELAKNGGLVNRDDFFDWCGKKQGECARSMRCRIEEIEEWKSTILRQGGPVMLREHMAMCKEVAAVFTIGVEKALESHRKWVEDQLKMIKLAIDKDVTAELRKLKPPGSEIK